MFKSAANALLLENNCVIDIKSAKFYVYHNRLWVKKRMPTWKV